MHSKRSEMFLKCSKVFPNQPSLSAGKDATIPSKSVTVFATQGTENGTTKEITYTDSKVIGNGSFGVVFQARLRENDQIVAIKRVLQDKRFKNRELNIMRKLDHCNIVKLLYYFFNEGERVSEASFSVRFC